MSEPISKTSRILSIYHMLLHGEIAEFEVLDDSFSVSRRTLQRDVRVLERVGVMQVRYDKARQGFVAVSRAVVPMAPEENKSREKYLKKIRRLCLLMAGMAAKNDLTRSPAEIYRALFPNESERTRQRDFVELNKLGYLIGYEPGLWWTWEIPGAYELDTVAERWR